MENKKIMRVVMLVEILIMLVILQISPSSAQDRGCLARISTCLDGASTHSELLGCCPIIKQEIKDERDCFCLLKDNALEDESFSDALSTVFSFCGISDTIHTLCPGPNPSPSGSLDPTPPSSPSSSGEHLIPPPAPVADTNNPTTSGKESESRSLSGSTNKIAYSVGLFPSLLLFIWATSVLIGYL